MAKLGVQQIRKLAKEIVAKNPGGIRYGQLLKQIVGANPETPSNTVQGSIWNLAEVFPTEVTKPSRGLFMPFDGRVTVPGEEPEPEDAGTAKEADFYKPFADWLKNDLDEVTVAVALGGSGIRGKWGTPDVVGVYKPQASNLVKFPLEIVTAEIKTNPAQPVVAFGQAIAYRLFSAKSYVVMPRTMSEEDFSRLESMSMLFGVGLVVFEPEVTAPNFEIRVRAQRFLPDMFYVNEFADRLRQHNAELFEELFR